MMLLSCFALTQLQSLRSLRLGLRPSLASARTLDSTWRLRLTSPSRLVGYYVSSTLLALLATDLVSSDIYISSFLRSGLCPIFGSHELIDCAFVGDFGLEYTQASNLPPLTKSHT